MVWPATSGPWRISVHQCSALLDCALWIRAAERIDVPPGDIVPGPLDLDPTPAATTGSDRATAESLARQWRGWWGSLVGAPGPGTGPPPHPRFEPARDTPDPLGLAGWPDLAALVSRRWSESDAWHQARKVARTVTGPPPAAIEGAVVEQVERTLGRPVHAFAIDVLLLPVRDDTVRKVCDHRYLVAQRLHDAPTWANAVRELILRVG